ncbi:3-hydroxyacyl-CoA dehydrogenase [Verminephrobacter aporrectodeae]|uniref:3-hydroxyacyl-CoA dehydrogenase n=1 Tax=Verminephrobacter aporrectodeae TaxID=1110389 RepID=UPI0002375A93|nr:3-hydroxyacyl-CoA dehydrogenase [Verminephrobacter aporrectodeae]
MAQLPQDLSDLHAHGLLDETPAQVLARVIPCASLEEALADATLVQENLRETLEAKRTIFRAMDRSTAPQTVLASSTSWIKASDITQGLAGRARMLVAHPVNPPHLVPLVELAPAPWTDAAVVQRARRIYTRAGQTPVLVRKEIRSFLLNRIQGMVLNEALNLYEQGHASAADLDLVLKDGLGLRWAFMGPFETIDLNAPEGLLDYARRYAPSLRELAQQSRPNDWDDAMLQRLNAERREALPADGTPARARWRDRRLMALLAHRRTQSNT